jgi:DNA polymerase III delta prime subunit
MNGAQTGHVLPTIAVPSFQEPGPVFDFVLHAAALATDYPSEPYLEQEGLLLTPECLTSAIESYLTQPGLLRVAQAWADNPHSPGHWLLLGAAGCGKSALLRALARALHGAHQASHAATGRWPMLVDLTQHLDAPSLEALLDSHVLARTGVARQGISVLRAVHLGHCLLLLDNAHALACRGTPLWDWCRTLLPITPPLQPHLRSGARVLLSCDDAAFVTRQDAALAAQALTPTWVNPSQQTRLMFLLGVCRAQVPMEDLVAAINGEAALLAVLDEVNESDQRPEMYRSSGWRRLAA